MARTATNGVGIQNCPVIRHVAILGLMGVGKSSVGAELVRRLGWPFVDNDAALAARTGGTPRDVEREVGAERLHDLEAQQLLEALAAPGPTVISAAASTIEDDRCRRALSSPDVFVVWLRAPTALLAARARRGDHRPELGSDLDALNRRQIDVRERHFRSAADLVIDASVSSPARQAARIEARLRRES